MFVNFKIILLSLFVVSVLSFEQNIHQKKKFKKGIQLKFSDVVKRAIDEKKDEKSENIPEKSESKVTKEGFTEAPIPAVVTNDSPKETVNEVPKEETTKDETKDGMDVKKNGERIEREGEEELRPVTPETPKEPKEVEEVTPPHSPTPLPPVTPPPARPTVPTASVPTLTPKRPVYPLQPTYPSNNFPNYWDNPNWGNWGRFMPPHSSNWPQQWPAFSWPSVTSVPQMPTYSPSNLIPSHYSPGTFAMISNSGIPTFSFLVPNNPYPGGRGYQYPGSQPSNPNYPGFQSGYQPRFIPSGGQTPGYYPGVGGQTPGHYPGFGQHNPGHYPGVGGQTPGHYPGMGGQTPGRYPGVGGMTPRFHPGVGGQQPPPQQPPPQQPNPQQPGADPNRPMGPMGPEFNDPDVTMIDPNQVSGNGGANRFPGKMVRELSTQ